MIEVIRIIRDASEVAEAIRECEEELKQRLWEEQWKDSIELPSGVRAYIGRRDGAIVIKMEI